MIAHLFPARMPSSSDISIPASSDSCNITLSQKGNPNLQFNTLIFFLVSSTFFWISTCSTSHADLEVWMVLRSFIAKNHELPYPELLLLTDYCRTSLSQGFCILISYEDVNTSVPRISSLWSGLPQSKIGQNMVQIFHFNISRCTAFYFKQLKRLIQLASYETGIKSLNNQVF